MTDEQIITAIAEACGWKWIQDNFESPSGFIGTNEPHSGNIPYEGRSYSKNRHLPPYGKAIPDYLNDLNAMHEAEKVLTEIQCAFYRQNLREIITDIPASRYVWHATARQRAEAFLRTVGKWEEVKS